MKFFDKFRKILGIEVREANNIIEYEAFKNVYVRRKVKDNQKYLQEILSNAADIVYREFVIGAAQQHLLMVFVDGMVEKKLIGEQVLKSLMVELNEATYREVFTIEEIKNRLVSTAEIREAETFDTLMLALMSGDTLIFAEGSAHGLIIGSKGWESRGVSEPTTEKAVKGPKDCFIETFRSNIVLIRRRIRDPNLAVEVLQIGRRTKTDVAIVYIKGVLNPEIAEEIKRRIQAVDIDGITDSSQLEELIAGHPWTIFPLGRITERPDKVTAALLEGRAAIVVDGSPFVLIVPVTFSTFLSAVDDYYQRSIVASTIRLTRYLSFYISAALPGLYLALVSFHPGMIPPPLALAIVGTRVALPFPSFVEMILMETVLEILQEAGIRLPQAIGQTVSIVGGIVIGQAAVQAGVVSPIIVIIVALTAITSFTLPSYHINLSSRILRMPFILVGATLGFYGIVILSLFVLLHMASLTSFGVGYLEDFSPYRIRDFKDIFIRVPMKLMRKRPEFLKPEDTQRQVDRKKMKEKTDDQ
ncbi:spore germination protein [Geosporobacter ferrireducens]|uniref:spore germination protein n=1 Tax=Geosporobacter ferrireducens TaxID=1424294 RepID=UPI00139CE26B|nr:spore germination protein [Geosporobacter ferrireducens]MTI55811.1 spore germination protein [Geosporobacter ferrireducens]